MTHSGRRRLVIVVGAIGMAAGGTERWFAGDTLADPYTIAIAPDAPPGTYTLISGMYDSATGERLEMRSADGTPLGTEAVLASVEVR